MDHCQSPRNRGRPENYDLLGTNGVLGQGPFVVFYLKLADDRIAHASFECNGCGVTVAICSVVTELVSGRTVTECQGITATSLTEALDGVPPDKVDRVTFVLQALNGAVTCPS